LRAAALALCLPGLIRRVLLCRKAGTKVKIIRTASLPAATARPMPSKKTVRMGDKAKPSGRWGTGGFAVVPHTIDEIVSNAIAGAIAAVQFDPVAKVRLRQPGRISR